MPRRKRKKKAAPKPTSEKSTKEKQACPYCGKEFVRLGRHLTSCPKKPENADAKKEE